MAITDVVVPQLSESVSEATLLTWKKQPGAAVEADEILNEWPPKRRKCWTE